MHLTPVSGSTLHNFFAVMHKAEVGSLSQGPSSHILSILVLSSSVHLPAATSFSKSPSAPGHENLLSVWHMAVSSVTRGSPSPRSTGANGSSGGAENTPATNSGIRGQALGHPYCVMYRCVANVLAAYSPPSFLLAAFLFLKLVVSAMVRLQEFCPWSFIAPSQQATAVRDAPKLNLDACLIVLSLMTLHGVVCTLGR